MATNENQQGNQQSVEFPAAHATATSSFLVSLDDMLTGSVTDYESYAPLLWFKSKEERQSSGPASTDFQASATLVHSYMMLKILGDSAGPTLRQAMRNGQNIVEMRIVRLGHADGTENTELSSSTFSDCKIEGIDEEMVDNNLHLILKVRVFSRSDEAYAIDTTGAEGEGNTASGWDYSTNTSTAD